MGEFVDNANNVPIFADLLDELESYSVPVDREEAADPEKKKLMCGNG